MVAFGRAALDTGTLGASESIAPVLNHYVGLGVDGPLGQRPESLEEAQRYQDESAKHLRDHYPFASGVGDAVGAVSAALSVTSGLGVGTKATQALNGLRASNLARFGTQGLLATAESTDAAIQAFEAAGGEQSDAPLWQAISAGGEIGLAVLSARYAKLPKSVVKRRKRQFENNKRIGKEFENAVIRALAPTGIGKNTQKLEYAELNGELIRFIPDMFDNRKRSESETAGITEIKNRKRIHYTRQIRAEIGKAAELDIPFNLVISPRYEAISHTIFEEIKRKDIDALIMVFDTDKGTFTRLKVPPQRKKSMASMKGNNLLQRKTSKKGMKGIKKNVRN